MARKSPYTYPHRSKRAQVEYLADHDSYGGWNHPCRRWSPLSWNGWEQDHARELVMEDARNGLEPCPVI